MLVIEINMFKCQRKGARKEKYLKIQRIERRVFRASSPRILDGITFCTKVDGLTLT